MNSEETLDSYGESAATCFGCLISPDSVVAFDSSDCFSIFNIGKQNRLSPCDSREFTKSRCTWLVDDGIGKSNKDNSMLRHISLFCMSLF